MPSPFTRLPQDMLQYEISLFLDPLSRAEFNSVLKADERVFKKLPKDYAISHEIEVKRHHYEGIARRLGALLNRLDWGASQYCLAEKEAKKLFAWLQSPSTAIIFAHKERLKAQMIDMIAMFRYDDLELYGGLDDGGRELLGLAEETCNVIESRPFVRQVHFSQRGFL
jgi:hypothetical protein